MSIIPRGSDLCAIYRLSQAPNVSFEKPQDILKAQPKRVTITIKRAVSINDVGSNLNLGRGGQHEGFAGADFDQPVGRSDQHPWCMID